MQPEPTLATTFERVYDLERLYRELALIAGLNEPEVNRLVAVVAPVYARV